MSNLPTPPGPGNQLPQPPRLRVPNWLILVLLVVFSIWFALRLPAILNGTTSAPVDVPYSFFRAQVVAGKVSSVFMQGTQVSGEFTEPMTYPPPGSPQAANGTATSKEFTTTLPPVNDNGLIDLLAQHNVTLIAADRTAWNRKNAAGESGSRRSERPILFAVRFRIC